MTDSFPLQLNIIPDQLDIEVAPCTLGTQRGTMRCWSYITKGLRNWSHRELALLVCRSNSDTEDTDRAIPQEPLQLLTRVQRFAAKGHRVFHGDSTQLTGALFGFAAIVWLEAISLEGIQLPSGALFGVGIYPNEHRALALFGASRLAAQLGEQARFYPYPPWIQPGRQALDLERSVSESLLGRVPRVRWPGATILRYENKLVLSLDQSTTPLIQQHLREIPSDSVMALLTRVPTGANACLVWNAGQEQPRAITPPQSRGEMLAGCFVMFVAGQPQNGIQLVEDGFVLLLTDENWSRLRQGFEQNKDCFWEVEDTELKVQWFRSRIDYPLGNPLPEAWKDFPTKPSPQAPVALWEIRLHHSQEEIDKRVPPASLTAFVRRIGDSLAKTLMAWPKQTGTEILLDIKLSAQEPASYHFAARPRNTDEKLLERCNATFAQQMPHAPDVTDAVSFQLFFVLWSGTCPDSPVVRIL